MHDRVILIVLKSYRAEGSHSRAFPPLSVSLHSFLFAFGMAPVSSNLPLDMAPASSNLPLDMVPVFSNLPLFSAPGHGNSGRRNKDPYVENAKMINKSFKAWSKSQII